MGNTMDATSDTGIAYPFNPQYLIGFAFLNLKFPV